jgi:hypothetical protein
MEPSRTVVIVLTPCQPVFTLDFSFFGVGNGEKNTRVSIRPRRESNSYLPVAYSLVREVIQFDCHGHHGIIIFHSPVFNPISGSLDSPLLLHLASPPRFTV